MTETKPKRRWFRFSLRTFLIAVTLFGGWIGWNFYELREREQCINYMKEIRRADIREYGDDEHRIPWRIAKFPRIWRLFGVRPVKSIQLSAENFGLSEAKLIAEQFPEAEVTFRNRDGSSVGVQ